MGCRLSTKQHSILPRLFKLLKQTKENNSRLGFSVSNIANCTAWHCHAFLPPALFAWAEKKVKLCVWDAKRAGFLFWFFLDSVDTYGSMFAAGLCYKLQTYMAAIPIFDFVLCVLILELRKAFTEADSKVFLSISNIWAISLFLAGRPWSSSLSGPLCWLMVVL